MSDEIYTKEEHYQDWKAENMASLMEGFIAEADEEEFEAYCRQSFRDRD